MIIKSGSFPLNTTCAVPVNHCHLRFLLSMRKVPWHFPVVITSKRKINSYNAVSRALTCEACAAEHHR